jgi:hypothetical protein
VTRRGEVRLLRMVKKNHGKVLREITNDFNEGGVVRVHLKTIYSVIYTKTKYDLTISMPFPFQIHN